MIVLSIPANKAQYLALHEISDFFIEYRLDYLNDPFNIASLSLNDKSIIALRNTYENENFLHRKFQLFKEFVNSKHGLVDIELSNYNDFKALSKNMILSQHFDSFDIALINSTLKTFLNSPAKLYKLALKINTYEELMLIKEACKSFDKKLIILSTGKLGKLSRILYNLINSIGTYICLDSFPTAENQLTLSEYNIYKPNYIDENSKLGGLVGLEQVYKSKGMKFYNQLFYDNKLNARYLPLFTENFSDLKNFIDANKKQFFAVSITMPYKYSLLENSVYNLFLPQSGLLFNTDIMAFQKIFNMLNLKKSDSVLIIGSGASSESALIALKNYSNVSLYSRNKISGNRLITKYQLETFNPKLQNYKIIINTTPLGLNNENLFNFLPKLDSDYLIDLPYSEMKTTAVLQYLADNKLVIDGHEFWCLQAEFQQHTFLDILQ